MRSPNLRLGLACLIAGLLAVLGVSTTGTAYAGTGDPQVKVIDAAHKGETASFSVPSGYSTNFVASHAWTVQTANGVNQYTGPCQTVKNGVPLAKPVFRGNALLVSVDGGGFQPFSTMVENHSKCGDSTSIQLIPVGTVVDDRVVTLVFKLGGGDNVSKNVGSGDFQQTYLGPATS